MHTKRDNTMLARQNPNAGATGRSDARPALRGFAAVCVICLAGCSAFKKDAAAVDRTYRTRVHSFSCPIGVTLSDTGIIQIGVTPTWIYNPPAAAAGKAAPSPTGASGIKFSPK